MLKNILRFFVRPTSFGKPVDMGSLIIRIAAGGLIVLHGWPKLKNFSEKSADFYDFLGLGFTTSLSMAIFAKFFCVIFIALGLLTRVATILILVTKGECADRYQSGHSHKRNGTTLAGCRLFPVVADHGCGEICT